MMIRVALFFCVLLASSSAWAVCPQPLTFKDAAGSTQNITSINDVSNGCVAPSALYPAVTFSGSLQSAAVANGNGTALTVTGTSSAILTVTCTSCSGGTTINFEGAEDTVPNYVAQNAFQSGTGTIATTTTAAGVTQWLMNTSGLQTIRARISGYSAGTITVTAHAVPIAFGPLAEFAVQSGTWTVNQGGTWTVQPGNTANTTPWAMQITQFGGNNVVTGTGASGNGIPRFTISNDSTVNIGNTANTTPILASVNDGTNTAKVQAGSTTPAAVDKALTVAMSPNSIGCAGVPLASTNWTPFSITTNTNTQIITGTSSKQTYICSLILVVSGPTNVALVEGTGSACATGTAGMSGDKTAATGWNLSANGGIPPTSGNSAIYRTSTAADNVCLWPSAASTQVSGTVVWSQQ